jgi:membrane associated rhomboid family serine protease
VWNVFTAGFCETNFLVMCVNVAALLYLGRRIEPVWGARVRHVAPLSPGRAGRAR